MILTDVYMVSNLIDFKYNGALAHSIFDSLTQIKRVEKEEYLKKKDAVIDKILDSAAYSDIPLNFTRDEFLAVLEKNI